MKQDESTYSAVQKRFKFNSLYEKIQITCIKSSHLKCL